VYAGDVSVKLVTPARLFTQPADNCASLSIQQPLSAQAAGKRESADVIRFCLYFGPRVEVVHVLI
jgi:hypothetical protein